MFKPRKFIRIELSQGRVVLIYSKLSKTNKSILTSLETAIRLAVKEKAWEKTGLRKTAGVGKPLRDSVVS